jgi:hypothetical protein
LKQQALAAYIPVYTALLDALVIRAQVSQFLVSKNCMVVYNVVAKIVILMNT